MKKERALKVVLVLVGLLFAAGVYPLVTTIRTELQPNSENGVPMILSLYVTLGVFLLLAARNPSANRTVIAYAAWSSLAHAAVMTVMSVQLPTDRAELLISSAALGIIGALLIVLAPGKQTAKGEHAAV
jgi:multidrug transporter EmrE-like cation transporter